MSEDDYDALEEAIGADMAIDELTEEIGLLKGSVVADERRLRAAEQRVFGDVTFGCDAPDHFADEIERLRTALGRIRYCRPDRSVEYCREIAIKELDFNARGVDHKPSG